MILGFDNDPRVFATVFSLWRGFLVSNKMRKEHEMRHWTRNVGKKDEMIRWRRTYSGEGRSAKAGAAVEPIIVAQFINLDALLIRGLMRHRLCHHQRLGVPLGREVVIGYQIRSDVEVLLQRQFR
jgi:hypothetical protein